MKIITDFVTNSSEADYYDCDCDCNRDCDCDCDCDCSDHCNRNNCNCFEDEACSLADYVNDVFDGNWEMFEDNMSSDW